MNLLLDKVRSSPVLARVVPLALFAGLTALQGAFGEGSRYWVYLGKTALGVWMIWTLRPFISEMRWHLGWEAVLIGVSIFLMWISLDAVLVQFGLPNSYPQMPIAGGSWNPQAYFGRGSALAGVFIAVRIFGATLVVPPLEEVFFRSFVYRFITRPDFQSAPLGQFLAVPFLATSVLFGFEHREWLAGILCGFALQALVCWKKRLGDAIAAHAITNFLLGLWIVWKGAWQFW